MKLALLLLAAYLAARLVAAWDAGRRTPDGGARLGPWEPWEPYRDAYPDTLAALAARRRSDGP